MAMQTKIWRINIAAGFGLIFSKKAITRQELESA